MIQESKDSIKARIRERYKGADTDNMDMIPAKPKESIFDEGSQKRVCAYCRVSTDDPRQTSSYELQKNHYEDFIKEHPGWVLVGIYADEGITGTSMEKRDDFNRMIADCRDGKVELVICKSVARFARNIVDCIRTVRILRDIKPPVGVYFEAEHINTLDGSSEMMLSILSASAQEESRTKSEIMNISIEQRFRRGVLLTPPLLGYDWDDSHRLTVNAQEAVTVRLAFTMLLAGFSKQQIADKLNELRRPSKLGNISWNASGVTGILRNERYCGDVLARKTFTPDYLTHKSQINRQNRNQYHWHKRHEAIVKPETWQAAQTILNLCKYSTVGAIPLLSVIDSGAMQGFVSVRLRQAWDDVDIYVRASLRAYGDGCPADAQEDEANEEPEAEPKPPAGYQVVRAGFFQDSWPTLTLSRGNIHFTLPCYQRLHETDCIELLLNPVERLLAIRPCSADQPNAICWTQAKAGKTGMRHLGAAAFLRMLMGLMGWNSDYRYSIRGYTKRSGQAVAMFFDLYEPEVHIRLRGDDGGIKRLKGYPAEWAGRFGLSAFDQFNSSRLPDEALRGLDAAGIEVNLHSLPACTHEDVAAIVRELSSAQEVRGVSDLQADWPQTDDAGEVR